MKRKSFRLGGELLACNDNGSNYFYIQNIRGDVMMLVNESGVVKSVRDYDANGRMLTQGPRNRDPFGFTGGLDSGNGIWKLGARFYDSGKGSFIQQDRYMGDPSDPLSLNRYAYCGLHPVNFVDPNGHFAIAIPLIIIAAPSTAVVVKASVAVAVGAIGAIIYKAARDKMQPDPLAGDAPHSVYQRNGTTGKIKKYETFKKQTDPYNPNPLETEKRYDGPGGKPEYNKVTGK